MSTTIMSACWPLQMPPTPKAVLISLADNANDQGHCWPSIPTICERTCFSERAVHRAISWLEEVGIVQGDRSNGRHTKYVLTPQNYTEPPHLRHPRISGTTADAAAQPPQIRQQPPQMRQEPPSEVRSNHQEPSRTVRSNRQSKAVADAVELLPELPVDLVTDFVAVRQAKKLPLTGTAVSGLQREAGKADLSLESAVRLCCERGWASLRADWVTRDNEQGAPPPASANNGGSHRELL